MDPLPSAYAYLRVPAPRSHDATPPPLNALAAIEGYCLESVWVDHGDNTSSFDAMMERLPDAPVKAIFASSWEDLQAIPRLSRAHPSVIKRYFGLPVFTLDVHRDQ